MFGRNGEAPVPIVAPRSPSDCFDAAVEAVRIAVTYRTPVIVLSDGYLANGSEPWRLPELDALPADRPRTSPPPPTTSPTTGPRSSGRTCATPQTLARAWAAPGTAGLEHRIGGLEKQDGTGNISYDPANHDLMVRTRQAKVDRIAASIPDLEVDDPDGDADILVLGLGIAPTARSVRRCDAVETQACTSPRPTSATSTRFRRTPSRC